MLPQPFKVIVPATTANLGAGFDCLALALSLYNELEITPSETAGLIVHGEGNDSSSSFRGNLVWQTFEAFFIRSGEKPPGVEICCWNRIPFTRGLGSSAAARIGALVAANHWLGNRFSRDEILRLAVQQEGHPDNVAAAILGGMVVCSGTSEDLVVKRIDPKGGIRIVLMVPERLLPTEEARSVLPQSVPITDAIANVQNTALTAVAFSSGDYSLLASSLSDRLHQPYRERLVPGFREVLHAAREAGAYGAALSGAGPTIAAFTSGHEKDVARAMREALLKAGGGSSKTLILDIDGEGTRLSTS